jgi:hypothetical protein
MTLAESYNAEAARIMPHMIDDLRVDPAINNESHIDEIVFHRSEFLGGMAAVILALIADSK